MRGRHLILLVLAFGSVLVGAGKGPAFLPTIENASAGKNVASYADYYAQFLPSPYSPERLPQPGSACFHLNYEGPGDDWDLEKVVQQLARKADCVVVLWTNLGDENCVALSQHLFGLLEKYGIGEIVVRVYNKMPGDYIQHHIIEGHQPALRHWYMGGIGIPPGISGDHRRGYVPTEGDIIANQLYLPSLQECWRQAQISIGNSSVSVAEWMALRLVYVQLYNEVDFEHEWDYSPEGFFVPIGDGRYKMFNQSYYLLGHWACTLSNGFSWLLYPVEVVQIMTIGGETVFSYDVSKPRIPIIIPPVATGNIDHIRDYLFGCLDGLHKIPINDYPVMGGYYSPFYGGTFAYAAHIYVPCTQSPYSAVHKVTDDLGVLSDILREYQNGVRFETPVRVIVTEFGCAQYGYTPNRVQQKALFEAATSYNLGTPLAWWVFAGRRCHSPYEPASGQNLPEDWEKLAIVDYKGNICDVEE